MSNLVARVRGFAKDESGASLIEYSILIGLITVAVIGLISGIGDWVISQWSALSSGVNG